MKQAHRRAINRLEKENSRLKAKLSSTPSLSMCVDIVSQFISGDLLKFVTTQLKLANRSPYGRRWTDHDKSVALSIYHASPKAYRLLTKLFILPSVETLKTVVRKLNVYTGIGKSVLQAINGKLGYLVSQSWQIVQMTHTTRMTYLLTPHQRVMSLHMCPWVSMTTCAATSQMKWTKPYNINSKVCNSCHETMKLATEAQRQHQLIKLKTHSASTSKGLQFPSGVLSDVLQSAETTFNKHIDVYLRLTGLKTNLLKILLNKTSFVDCQCRSHFKVMRLFLNVRLFYCLKLCNRDLVDSSEKRKSRKYIKLAHS